MEIYVDELPKNCFECPCFKNDIEFPCGLSDGTKDYFLDEIDGGECPLKLISDYKKHDFKYDENNDENILGLAFVKYIFGDKNEDTKLNKLIKEVIEETKNTFKEK